MSGIAPSRPSGSTPQARWCQWVHDSIFSFLRVGQVRGAKVSSTTGGVFVEPLDLGGIGGGSRVKQYVLTDASDGDFFVCRTWNDSGEKPSIGAADVFVAKPFHLRRSPFDRSVLNKAAPGNIGTVSEITYHIVVESWNGVTFSSAIKKLSHEYKSATFRIATDETNPDPDNWFSENQTVIPRFVPAILAAPEGGPVTTATISPTIIYAAQCSGLGIKGPDDVVVRLLALCDGWAWMRVG